MTDQVISPLRRRMIEDMAVRKFAPKTQHDYVQRVKDFAAFLGRSPDLAKSEEVRGFFPTPAPMGRWQRALSTSGDGSTSFTSTRARAWRRRPSRRWLGCGKELPRLSGKSKLAEAIRYATSGRIALERFLGDGRIEIDSNIVERVIRPRGQPWRRQDLGEHRHASADREDE